MKKFLAILLTLASIPLLLVGALFLIAASAPNTPGRLPAGLFFAVLGAVVLVLGLRRLRRLAETTPEALKTGAVNLARRLGGEVTVSQLRAEFHISQDEATEVLDGLVAEGAAARERREERTVYVFTGLLPSLSEKVCPYCGTQLPVRSALRKCPNCGAQLEIEKT
jgi:rubrerythrin